MFYYVEVYLLAHYIQYYNTFNLLPLNLTDCHSEGNLVGNRLLRSWKGKVESDVPK
jgi:hypothetical protein